ncbi:right-handed parallel beta-helix repeat-containing protein [Flavobacterium sp. 3HN19-14]|uniref:right-handed parallel beta-helix repeat-containing protein n=1 Tax=Flavobacterium sp. 3HN19-14 TaxID=3448133 RepID=UPI003EE2A584
MVIWNGFKKNIKFTNNTVTNNNCCGIELADGTASGVIVTGNTITIGSGDNGIGLCGLNTNFGANLIDNNNITGGGRFGIELKNPDGATVSNNTITMATANADLRDRAGIAVMRRAYLAADSNGVNVPNNVTVSGNTVTGFTQSSDSDGYGIVVEGTDHTVTGNTLTNNDIAIQQQAGNQPYTGLGSDDGDQNNKVDNYFGRGNSPVLCNITLSGNTFSGNGTDARIVTGGGVGTIQTAITPTVDDPADQVHCAGEASAVTFTGNALTGVVYNWTNDNTNTGLAASGSGNISITTANTTGVPQVSTVVVTPVVNGCSGTPQTFTITVNPNPTLGTVTADAVCAGNTTTVSITGLLPNVAGSITYTYNGGATYLTESGTADGSGNFSWTTPVLTMAENGLVISVTKVKVTATGCELNYAIGAKTVTLTVKPNPSITSLTPSAASVCEGTQVSFTASGLVNGMTDFTYTINGNPGAVTALVSGGTYNFGSVVYPVGTYNVVITSATINGCTTTFTSGNTTSFTVNPNIPVSVSIASSELDNEICAGPV